MFTLRHFFLFFTIFGVNNCGNYNDHNNLLNGLINMFKNLSVHTVWTTTCWDTSKANLLYAKNDLMINHLYESIM